MKKYLLVLILAIGITLSGCGQDASMEYYEEPGYNNDDTVLEETPPVIEEATDQGGDVATDSEAPALENRKIIYRAALQIAVSNPTTVYDEVITTLADYTAYVEEANITTNYYEITIRVLSTEFDALINDIIPSGELVSFSKTSEDVTNEYSTFEARKLALEVRHTRILELIAVATDLDTILLLEEERFEIEADLNQIGIQLANFDSLVDYSTITLKITEATEQIIVLPRTSEPYINITETTKNSMTLELYNQSEENITMHVDLYLNGEFVEEYEENMFGDSKTIVTFDELKSNKEYTIKVTALADDHRISLSETRRAETLKTYGNRTTNTFVQSWTVLVAMFEFIGLATIGVLPFAIVGGLIFIPIRVLIIRRRNK